jgi:hypothetical protein
MNAENQQGLAATLDVEASIILARGVRVMLDSDLAALYGVETGALVRAVHRNVERFPADFMFQLTTEEYVALRSQICISKPGRGGRRYLPYAFTEHGVAMLSSALRSERVVKVNIEIVRAFVRLRHLRHLLGETADLTRQLDELERRYDRQFKVVFDAIRQLMTPHARSKRELGFRPTGER